MTRRIAAHKGGRTCRAPEARMTPQERGRLDAVLQRRGVRYVDWLIGNVNKDYKQSGGTMSTAVICPRCGNEVEIDETGVGLCERDRIWVKPANDGTNDGIFASDYDVVEAAEKYASKK